MAEGVIEVTVKDLATSEEDTQVVANHDYLLITTGDCHIAHVQSYPKKGTHVITVKGRRG